MRGLLDRIPLDAAGFITLSDLDAAREQIAPFVADTGQFESALLPFTMIYPPNGFDANGLTFYEDGAVEVLGFSVFEIDQMAGWGDLPLAPVIMTGVVDRVESIGSALGSRGFETTVYQGHTIWHRQDDLKIDLKHRNEEPFGGQMGMSQRFSIDGDDLLFTRDWPTMHRLLDGGPGLSEDPDSVAILRAGYLLPDVGELVDAVLVLGQPVKLTDPIKVIGLGQKTKFDGLGISPAGLPPFARYGLLLWQDGATVTGAIAIPYANVETANSALDRFVQLLDTTNAPSVDRPFSEILSENRHFDVVETVGRHVLIIGFRQELEIANPLPLTTFMRNPRQRLMDMLIRRDLDHLIGASQ